LKTRETATASSGRTENRPGRNEKSVRSIEDGGSTPAERREGTGYGHRVRGLREMKVGMDSKKGGSGIRGGFSVLF